jgi:hypothetical protein
MPFGKHKGMFVRQIPDHYLSWLAAGPRVCPILWQPEWAWLRESVLAELRFRGFRADLAGTLVEATDCDAVVPPYWNTLLQCTSETCHRPLPCAIHDAQRDEPKILLETKRRIQLEGEP